MNLSLKLGKGPSQTFLQGCHTDNEKKVSMVKETANKMISEHNLVSVTIAILKGKKKQSLVKV